MTHYVDSKGRAKPIAEMPTPYLANAIRKLEREDPARAELPAMRAEHANRPDKDA